MELEASYDESYCLEGRAERRRGATDTTDEAREAVGMACVYRHIFFITPLMVCLERQIALTPTMSPAPSQARTNQDSYGGVGGQNVDLRKHLQQLLAPVERVHCPERLRQRCGARQMRGWKEGKHEDLVVLKSTGCLLPSSWPRRAPCRTRALSPRCACTGS